MCSTHTDRQDGGGGPGGACACKRGDVLQVKKEGKLKHLVPCALCYVTM